jgi:hypothetical protein
MLTTQCSAAEKHRSRMWQRFCAEPVRAPTSPPRIQQPAAPLRAPRSADNGWGKADLIGDAKRFVALTLLKVKKSPP